MAYPKKVNAEYVAIKDKAVSFYHGFVSCVVGNVNKIGLEVVMNQHCGVNGATEYYWLKQAMERLLNFAEECQLKAIPTKIDGIEDHKHFTVVFPNGVMIERASVAGNGEQAVFPEEVSS